MGTSVHGKNFVTARGWDDLSHIIRLYEKNGFPVRQMLVSQYLQDEKTSREFTSYYALFQKYKSDYQVDRILSSKGTDEIKSRAKAAQFDERLSLISLILEKLFGETKEVMENLQMLTELRTTLRELRVLMAGSSKSPGDNIDAMITGIEKKTRDGKASGSLSKEGADRNRSIMSHLSDIKETVIDEQDSTKAFKRVNDEYKKIVERYESQAESVKKRMDNAFEFLEAVFPEGQEMLIFITELTINSYCARFISEFGSEGYFKHNKELLFYERQKEIISQLKAIDLSE